MKLKSKKGAGLVEYTVLAGLLSVTAIGSVYKFSQHTQKTFVEAQVMLAADEATLVRNGGRSSVLDHTDAEFSTDFTFPDTLIGTSDSRIRVKSAYVDLPFDREDYGQWYSFSVWSNDGEGNPSAVRHIQSGGSADEGYVQYGTMLEIDIPDLGETRNIYINVGGKIGSWTISRDDYSPVQPFGFADTSLAWDETRTRITSQYLDIDGLSSQPLPFSVSSSDGTGNPLAIRQVEGGGSSNSGELTQGTMLEVNTPEPGETQILTLTVDGVQGTWRVEREPVPPLSSLTLSANNGHGYARLDYSDNGVPDIARSFTITGTGSTNPYLENISSGTGTSGMTAAWGSNIRITVPPSSSEVETITLTIDGEIITWTVTGY
jgi:Flp pilus assembly pilin Flp